MQKLSKKLSNLEVLDVTWDKAKGNGAVFWQICAWKGCKIVVVRLNITGG